MKTTFLSLLLLFSSISTIQAQKLKEILSSLAKPSTPTQTLTKTLINDNLEQLFLLQNTPSKEEQLKKHVSEMSNIYYYEIEYNNKLIAREVISKENLDYYADRSLLNSNNRYTGLGYIVYIDASLISDADKLSLIVERREGSLINFGNSKLVKITGYLIKKDRNTNNKYVVSTPPLPNMKINIYKIEFK